jgi:hypothetical protein
MRRSSVLWRPMQSTWAWTWRPTPSFCGEALHLQHQRATARGGCDGGPLFFESCWQWYPCGPCLGCPGGALDTTSGPGIAHGGWLMLGMSDMLVQ